MASTLTKTLSFSHLLTSFLNPLTSLKPFSITATPTPLLYEAIIYRPRHAPRRASRRSPGPEPSFEDWADSKLTQSPDTGSDTEVEPEAGARRDMTRTERKYLRKRKKRLYGGDSDDERKRVMEKGEVVELVPEIVKFESLHEREEELYFYDAFCFPWEKNKHYQMMYHLEKKFFPDHCLDKAFFKPGERKFNPSPAPEDSALVFFEKRRRVGAETGEGGGEGEKKETETGEEGKELSVRKVGEFFKDLKKGTGTGVGKSVKVVGVDVPFLASRSNGLPPKWDCLAGTAVLVNKPKGWTSFTVCGKLRRLVKVKKVGHAGTLDPMATGLLIVCVGKATKVVDSYQGMVKGYSGTFRLGEATSTWDADSPVIQREPWEHIKDRDIKKAVASFTGEIWQVPPMFSAIKVGGEKMYDKARRGESIELAPRQISIFQFDVERSLEDRQNLIFRVTCSKGTYIRSLCADLGKALGSCAHLTSLRRDSIGEYTADDAFEFHELEELIPKSYI